LSLLDLARGWVVVATQSIGGGPATLLLIRREFVQRRAWLTQRQFLEDYALSKMGLGINLITMAGLVGSRVAGLRGAVVSLVALLAPAVAIAVGLTAGYVFIRDAAVVRAALAGAGPVAAGMTAGFALSLARQSVRRGPRASIDYGFSALVFSASLFADLSPLIVIPLGMAVGVLFLRGESSRASGEVSG
jgi:chromate transporter